MNKSATMRVLLAQNAGIILDEPEPITARAPVENAAPRELSDEERALIREIIAAAGAPPSDLDWLVASCPSVEHALTYQPSRAIAYCARCQGPRVCDADGCIVCRTVIPEGSG